MLLGSQRGFLSRQVTYVCVRNISRSVIMPKTRKLLLKSLELCVFVTVRLWTTFHFATTVTRTFIRAVCYYKFKNNTYAIFGIIHLSRHTSDGMCVGCDPL